MAKLIEHIVREELEGRGDRLKAFTIAMDVFGRGADFDPQTDSIVRVEMFRLRTALAEYYETTGSGDRVQVRIPKGKYRPHFVLQETVSQNAPAPDDHQSRYIFSWMTATGLKPIRGALGACLAVMLFVSGYLMAQPSALGSEVNPISSNAKSDCPKVKMSQKGSVSHKA